MMSKCLEYFDKDLLSCGVVNSNWFYHVWNVNSVYMITLQKTTLHHSKNEKSNATRLWQRLIHAKLVWLYNHWLD